MTGAPVRKEQDALAKIFFFKMNGVTTVDATMLRNFMMIHSMAEGYTNNNMY